MSYPLTPDFVSGQPDSAWWAYALPDGSQNICSTTGAAFLSKLRGMFGLDPTPVWDASLQSGLISQAGAYPSVQAQLQSDLANNTVTKVSLTFGVYLAYYAPSQLQLASIGLNDVLAAPQFGIPVSPSADPSGITDDLVCFNPVNQVAPLSLSFADRSIAQQQSASGVRLAPGQQLPIAAQGLSPVSVLFLGAAFVAGVWWLSEQNKKAATKVSRTRR
jgi:hypothetical protein